MQHSLQLLQVLLPVFKILLTPVSGVGGLRLLSQAKRKAFLTGCTAWTLYQYDWYLGDSLCLPAGQRATDTGLDFEQILECELHLILEQKCKTGVF